MNGQHRLSSRQIRALLFIGAALAGACALAAPRAEPTADALRYQQERAVCLSDRSHQDRATCLREAAAAYAEARHGGLNDDATTYTRNAGLRCDALPDGQRQACQARMQGQGRTSGSVTSGGIYREISTPERDVPGDRPPKTPAPDRPAK
jgi:hypothetical protein